MDDIDKPLVPTAPKSVYTAVWKEVEDELESLVTREQVRKFAMR